MIPRTPRSILRQEGDGGCSQGLCRFTHRALSLNAFGILSVGRFYLNRVFPNPKHVSVFPPLPSETGELLSGGELNPLVPGLLYPLGALPPTALQYDLSKLQHAKIFEKNSLNQVATFPV